ncbi:hypothetical protein [Rhizobium leguminosarum]|uniref:hypothetical protein n=1 Tax=Rhizobium leguminosarum TaxID=384 RepID=UPI00396566DA
MPRQLPIAFAIATRSHFGTIEWLQEALRHRRATPGEIANQAERGGVGSVIRLYLEALTANG